MSVQSLASKAAIALLVGLLVPMPASAIIDRCTIDSSGCVPAGNNGFAPSNGWAGFWNRSPTYGTQLVVHQDICDQMLGMTPGAEPLILSPDPITDPNYVACAAPSGIPSPPCICPDTPEPLPVLLPSQLMETTAFWDGKDAYVIGGVKDLAGTEVSDITRFSQGMPLGPFGPNGGPWVPNAPGGEIQTVASLPHPLGRQALAYDPNLDTVYTFGGTNAGALNNEIYSFYPPSLLVSTMNCVLPRQFDYMAGAWADGAAYLFGGRYLEGDGNTVPFSLHTSNEIYRFDPATCTVSLSPNPLPPTVAPTPNPTTEGKRYDLEAQSTGSDIFLFGGTYLEDVACSTPTEISSGACIYNPLCPTSAPNVPCPVPQCSIMKFTPSTGVTTMINPYFPQLCGSLSSIYDGRYIYVFAGGSAYRYDPTTPFVNPTFIAGLPVGTGNPLKTNDYMRGGFVGVSAISTGCSGYLFGGLVDGIPVTAPPDGPISDKITWFGKCKPQAILQPTYAFTCPNYPIWFDARDSIVGEADFKWAKWDFGDGPSATNPIQGRWFDHPYDWYNQYAFVSHVYANPGIYTVTVTITDLNGLSSVLTSGFKATATATVPIVQDSTCDGFTGTKHHDPLLTWPFGVSLDSDLDGIPDLSDDCPSVANNDQADGNGDGMGDACTAETVPPPVVTTAPEEQVIPLPDADHDGIPDVADDCASTPNHDQADMDTDRKGDVCDIDIDGDGVRNSGPAGAFLDNCPWYPNPDQLDSNNDGVGNECSYIDSPGSAVRAGSAAGNAAERAGGLPWSSAATMAVLAALGTAALLLLVLRRPMKGDKGKT